LDLLALAMKNTQTVFAYFPPKYFRIVFLAPAKLERHFQTNQPSYKNKDTDFFEKNYKT